MWASEQSIVETRLYPRTLCAAETLWAEGHAGDLADFEKRWPDHKHRLDKFGVSPEYKRPAEPVFKNTGLGQGKEAQRSEITSRDFILTFDLDTDKTVDFSGILLRDNFRLNVTPPSGHVLMRSLRALKGWHSYEVTARGSVISLTIDGCLAWSISNADIRSGHISVEKTEGVQSWRNVALRNLD